MRIDRSELEAAAVGMTHYERRVAGCLLLNPGITLKGVAEKLSRTHLAVRTKVSRMKGKFPKIFIHTQPK